MPQALQNVLGRPHETELMQLTETLSRRHIDVVPNPLDALAITATAPSCRDGRLRKR